MAGVRINKHCKLFQSILYSKYCVNNKLINTVHSNKNKDTHPFRETLLKKNVIALLASDVLYSDGQIAVFNKPAGVAKSHPLPEESSYGCTSTIYMDDIMSDISKITGFPNPKIVKFPEKYASGVMIIAANDECVEKVAKCKRKVAAFSEYYDKYLAICQGRPLHHQGSYRLAVKLESKLYNKRKVRVLKESWTNNDMKRQDVKVFRAAHHVVKEGLLASLCSVSLSSVSKNALRLYFATKLLAPLLGDKKFSSRVGEVLGVPMLLDPFSDVANSQKSLHPDLLRALDLNSNESAIVPQCVHLAEVTLPRYKNGKNLTLRAPVPATFIWVCKQLDIYDEQLQNFGAPAQLPSQKFTEMRRTEQNIDS